ncbi:MAG: hypothetical protein OEO79_05825 [Gemmatimonadota bacterium]|nr:hypothetical protein [Gemmatimonadota bacterium]
MQPPTLVVSNPPHRKVDLDAVAAMIGLDVYETRLKFIFSAPEVLAALDGEYATAKAESFESAGVSVAQIDGRELTAIPWPEPVSSFEFTGKGLTARIRSRNVELPYDSSVVGVYCKPPSNFRVEPSEKAVGPLSFGLEVAEAIEWMANLDLYFFRDDALQRLSIVQGVTDFSGLGPMQKRTADENMAEVVAGCSRRFTSMHLDARMENVRPRRRFVGGDSAHNPDLRKRYSFGTLLLREILNSVSPGLGDLTQYELGSRLGYLTGRSQISSPRR